MSSPDDALVPGGDPLLDSLEAGFLLGGGRYTLKRLIGQGEGSVVWLAVDAQLGEELALKFFSARMISAPGVLAEARREVQRSRRLSHPNIVRMHDFYHAADEPTFVAMEFVEGRTLEELRRESADQVMEWDYLKPLVLHACAALEYAHAEGLAHGNIKPGNLILDGRGRLKLADFGLAWQARDLAYASPQVLDGKPGEASDDIYALGASLYELLSSKPPFWAGDIAHQIRRLQPQPLAERFLELGLEQEVPGEVSALLMACLAKDPAHRPASVSAVAEWIGAERAVVKETPLANAPVEPISLMPPTVPRVAPVAQEWVEDAEIAPEPKGSNAGKIATLIAGVLLLGLGYLWGLRQPGKETDEAKGHEESVAEALPTAIATPVIQAGRGPFFSYFYQPRVALALDTNAVNSGVAFKREQIQNCSFVYTAGENNSAGTITYEFRTAPQFVFENMELKQSTALFRRGRIQGEYSVDGGQRFELFFSTPESTGGYYKTAHLRSLNASNLVIRYTLVRFEGVDYNVQFIRDSDDAPAALEISGTVVPVSQATERPRIVEFSSTPDRSEGLHTVLAGDGAFSIVDQGGRQCWLVPKQHLYFGVDDAKRASFGNQCEIELEYRNTGSGEILLHYDSTDEDLPLKGAYKEHSKVIRRMNTGQWMKATFPITDARFANSQNEGADFRLYNKGDALLVRSARIILPKR